MGLLPLPCSAPVERCAHFGANDVPNSKEGKTRRTSRNACDSLSHTRAVVACRNYGRLNSWEFQRSLFASAQLGCLEGSLFALRSASRVQMVIIWLRAARGSKDSIEDGSSWKTGAALVKPFHPAVPMVFRSSVHDQAMDQRHLAFAPSRRRCNGSAKDEKAARQGPRPRLQPHSALGSRSEGSNRSTIRWRHRWSEPEPDE